MVGMHDLCGQIKVTSSVMQRAEAVQETLDAKFPSFVKPMIRSNVKKGFWLVNFIPVQIKFYASDRQRLASLGNFYGKLFPFTVSSKAILQASFA